MTVLFSHVQYLSHVLAQLVQQQNFISDLLHQQQSQRSMGPMMMGNLKFTDQSINGSSMAMYAQSFLHQQQQQQEHHHLNACLAMQIERPSKPQEVGVHVMPNGRPATVSKGRPVGSGNKRKTVAVGSRAQPTPTI